MSSRFSMRFCAVLFSLALVGVAASASAHVTVSSPDATAGGWGKLVFRVPTESETASTTSITVKLPTNTPLARVSSQPKPGWTVKLTKVSHEKPIKVGDFELTETISAVTWTTTGDGIEPGEFDEFSLSVGPLPEAESLSFSVDQRYSDDTTVSWDEIAEGDAEPEHPAPLLELAAAETGGHSHGSEADESTSKETGAGSDNGLALGLAGSALVLAAVGLVLGLRNNRRNA